MQRTITSAVVALFAVVGIGASSASASVVGQAASPFGGSVTVNATCDQGWNTILYYVKNDSQTWARVWVYDSNVGTNNGWVVNQWLPANGTITPFFIFKGAATKHQVWGYVQFWNGTRAVDSVVPGYFEAAYGQSSWGEYPDPSDTCTVGI